MSYEKVPAKIQREVVRQQTKMGWPDYVPAFAEFPDAKGKVFFCRYSEVTIARCEQVVEHYTRRARRAIMVWMRRPSRRMCRKAAFNILRARAFSCRYISLIGKTDSTEADMPFPCMSKEEIEKLDAE